MILCVGLAIGSYFCNVYDRPILFKAEVVQC